MRNPIEGNTKTHWVESGEKDWTVLHDERDQRQVEKRSAEAETSTPKHIGV